MDILKSKKFQAAVLCLVAALTGHYALGLDNETLLTILSPLWLYIIGQGLADIGKERAKVENGRFVASETRQ